MADEAVVRIVLQGEGGPRRSHDTSSATSSAKSYSPERAPSIFDRSGQRPSIFDRYLTDITPPPPARPPSIFDRYLTPEVTPPQQQTAPPSLPKTETPPPAFDPAAAARQRIDRERQQEAIDAEYRKQKGLPSREEESNSKLATQQATEQGKLARKQASERLEEEKRIAAEAKRAIKEKSEEEAANRKLEKDAARELQRITKEKAAEERRLLREKKEDQDKAERLSILRRRNELEAQRQLFMERKEEDRRIQREKEEEQRRLAEIAKTKKKEEEELSRTKKKQEDDARKEEERLERLRMLGAIDVHRTRQERKRDEQREQERLTKEARDKQREEEELQRKAQEEAKNVFDPAEEARQRRESEVRRAQVEAEYKRMYGDDEQESDMDSMLKIAGMLRGTMGGIFGTAVGAAMDIASSLRDAQAEASREQRNQELLNEAKQATASTSTPATSLASNTPSTQVPASTPTSPARTRQAEPTDSRAGSTSSQPSTSGAQGAKTANPAPSSGPPAAAKPAAAGSGAGAASGAGGLAAAAGPIGMAVAVAGAVKEMDQAMKGAVRDTISTIGDWVAGFASADTNPAKPLAAIGEAASSAADKIPVFSMQVLVAGEALKGFANVMQSLNSAADRFGEFSPEIAQAQAIAEIRHTMGDVRRAQEIGSQMAKFVMAQSDLQQKFEDIKVRMLQRILPVVTKILEGIDMITPTGEGIEEAIKLLGAPLTLLANVGQQILGIEAEKKLPAIPDDPTDVVLGRAIGGGVRVPEEGL